ncbi:MAG: Fe-S cluster assembly sulfur transfer protein SufU [Pseudomonadota bacterium]
MSLDDLRAIYQELILDHGKSPRNFAQPQTYTHKAAGYNPVCGDQLVVYLNVNTDDHLQGCHFTGQGCAICIASASIMSEMVRDKSKAQVITLVSETKDLATGVRDEPNDAIDEDDRIRLTALSGVRMFPTRVKCATLAWHTLQAALDNVEEVSTE